MHECGIASYEVRCIKTPGASRETISCSRLFQQFADGSTSFRRARTILNHDLQLLNRPIPTFNLRQPQGSFTLNCGGIGLVRKPVRYSGRIPDGSVGHSIFFRPAKLLNFFSGEVAYESRSALDRRLYVPYCWFAIYSHMRWFGHTGHTNDPDVRSAQQRDYQFREGLFLRLNFKSFWLTRRCDANSKTDQSSLKYLR